MKALKQNGNTVIMFLIEAVVGILLLVDPLNFTSGIIMIAGIALMICGLVRVIQYFRSEPQEAAVGQLLAKGIIYLLAGAFCTFNSEWFIVTFPIIAILYGIGILLIGVGKLQTTMDLLRLKNKKWWWSAISAAISVTCALVIILNPFTTTVVLWRFTGISLLVEAVFDIITLFVSRKNNFGTEG
jgi:uncharacterized membrane protein HdeD (DUF308 family)